VPVALKPVLLDMEYLILLPYLNNHNPSFLNQICAL
jgi:hypothetical protein